MHIDNKHFKYKYFFAKPSESNPSEESMILCSETLQQTAPINKDIFLQSHDTIMTSKILIMPYIV